MLREFNFCVICNIWFFFFDKKKYRDNVIILLLGRMGGREWNILKNNGIWLCVLYLLLKVKRFWYIGVRGIDLSKVLYIINCNYG